MCTWSRYIMSPTTICTKRQYVPSHGPQSRPRVTLSSLGVHFGFAFQKSASAMGPLWVCLGSALSPRGVSSAPALRGSLYALRREANPALLLLSGSPAPCTCIFQIHLPTLVRKLSFSVAIGSIHVYLI